MSMRCEEARQLLLSGGLVGASDDAREGLLGHLEHCPDCRAYGSGLAEDDRRLEALVVAAQPDLERLERSIAARVAAEPGTASRRRPIDAPWLRWAAAAVVAVCVLLGFNWMRRGTVDGVVWADVIARVEEADSFVCRRLEQADDEPDQEIVEYRSAEYGLRQDIYVGGRLQAEQFVVPSEKRLYALIHRDRTYLRQAMDDQTLQEVLQQGNARQIVASFRGQAHDELGRRRIDGKLCEGIEIVDPPEWRTVYESGVWRLWVDLQTQWPVRIELEGTAAAGRMHKKYTLYDFQWNPGLNADRFEVRVPEGYRLIADLAAPAADEASALQALRAYAELTGGRYPSTLSLATAIAEAEEELDRRHDRYDAAAGHDLKALFLIVNTCEFFADLGEQGREPRYHGDSVTPRDFDRELMSWRLDDGRRRVVWGDLRTGFADSVAAADR